MSSWAPVTTPPDSALEFVYFRMFPEERKPGRAHRGRLHVGYAHILFRFCRDRVRTCLRFHQCSIFYFALSHNLLSQAATGDDGIIVSMA